MNLCVYFIVFIITQGERVNIYIIASDALIRDANFYLTKKKEEERRANEIFISQILYGEIVKKRERKKKKKKMKYIQLTELSRSMDVKIACH